MPLVLVMILTWGVRMLHVSFAYGILNQAICHLRTGHTASQNMPYGIPKQGTWHLKTGRMAVQRALHLGL